MKKLNIDKIYLCHWDKLTERKLYLEQVFRSLDITNDIKWITDYNKETWDVESLTKMFPKVFGLNPSGRHLKPAEISLVLKHIDIIIDAHKNRYESVLVLEDDVLFHNNFVDDFNRYVSELPIDYDMCFIGSCCNLHAQNITSGKHVYPATGSRCTHAYMFSLHFVDTVINEISNVDDGADFYYNQLITKFGLKNYWFEPSLVSQNQMFNTTIQN
jgi:GR25 family glycosyltransferase involved in LPS biosynthesis